MIEPALSVRGLQKSYGDHQVLYGMDLEVAGGATLGLVGPNGVGKTTCLRCITGLVHPDAGSIHIAGIDARREPVKARRALSYLPGEASVYRWMRGNEFLRFGLGFHADIDDAFVRRCLDAFELPIDARLRSYSSGQKQMLALTVALGPRVPLYILDEPEKALDASKRHALRDLLRELRQRGSALLISSHHISELEQLTNDHAFLSRGRVLEGDEVDAMLARLALRLRVRLAEGVALPDLATTVTRLQDGSDWILEATSSEEAREVAMALLAHGALRLEVGAASLHDVYEDLYVRQGSAPR